MQAPVGAWGPGREEEPRAVDHEGKFFSPSFGIRSMTRSRGASFHAVVLKPGKESARRWSQRGRGIP